MGRFTQENISVEVKSLERQEKTYLELKFPNLLMELGISSNPREKLMIKIDYSSSWKGQDTEVVLFNKYGFLGRVVVNKINQVLVQKLVAYTTRKTTQPRDIYDIVWLYSQKAVVDIDFALVNGHKDLVESALRKYESEGVSHSFKNKLEPFLFNSQDVKKLDLLGEVLMNLK